MQDARQWVGGKFQWPEGYKCRMSMRSRLPRSPQYRYCVVDLAMLSHFVLTGHRSLNALCPVLLSLSPCQLRQFGSVLIAKSGNSALRWGPPQWLHLGSVVAQNFLLCPYPRHREHCTKRDWSAALIGCTSTFNAPPYVQGSGLKRRGDPKHHTPRVRVLCCSPV